jgi:hypothetical protein
MQEVNTCEPGGHDLKEKANRFTHPANESILFDPEK